MSEKILLLGFLTEQAYFENQTKNDPHPQVAARKLEIGFLSGFLENGLETEVFGFFPSSTFPANGRILFGFKNWILNGARCRRLPFINLPGVKLLTRLLALTVALFSLGPTLRKASAICVYSTHTPLIVSANIIRAIFGIPFYVIIPDLPEMMNVHAARRGGRAFLKKLDSHLVRKLVSRASGISAVTRHIVTDNSAWKHIPFVVIEGLLPEDSPEYNHHPYNGRPYFLYSGGLNKAYGVERLLSAFIGSDIDADLWICGSGPLADFVNDCQKKDGRVRSLGFLNQTSLRSAQMNAIGLLITRDPNEDYVRYSFPSKLIEYMATGTPVITTRLPGIPEEYFNYVSTIESSTDEAIINALKAHLKRDFVDRGDQGLRAQRFVIEKCKPRVAVLPLLDLMRAKYD